MDSPDRYAIYWAPEPGPFAEATAQWLGWDAIAGREVAHPAITGLPRPLPEITATPRPYGFHGTVKPPFRLADGKDPKALQGALEALCRRIAPVDLPGLQLHTLGGFVALVPEGDPSDLASLAARIVVELDPFRAPPTEAEIARRRPEHLSARQRANLSQWGYPYVLDEFQFHLTLTGNLPQAEVAPVQQVLAQMLGPLVPRPFRVDTLCLFKQPPGERFRLVHRYPLSG